METLLQDLRYGARTLWKRPGFTLVAVVTLALGIGANTAVFSYVNSLFLQPLPVGEPDRLVRLYGTGASGQPFGVFSYANFADLRERAAAAADFAAHQFTSVSFNAGGGAESAAGEVVTGNYFSVMRADAALGRALSPEDDRAEGAHPVVVLGHGMWQRRFGGERSVVGRAVQINGHTFTVVGVMPPEFKGTFGAVATEFWVPLMMHEEARPRGVGLQTRGWGWLFGTARLREGVGREQLQAEVARASALLRAEHPNEVRDFHVVEAGMLPEEYRGGASNILLFFMVVVALLLLAACANVASVLLSRVASRRQEIAIRQSLGATRWRLMRQWLTESLLIAAAGGAAGLAVAAWMSDALMSFAPPVFINFSPALGLDARVLSFTAGVALLTGLLCGLFPALRASRTDVSKTLKEGGSAAGGRTRSRLQQTFVVVQVAVSLVLLIASALLLRSVRESQSFGPGFNSDNLLVVKLDLRRHRYTEERGRVFYQELTERLKRLPGVEGVALGAVTPLAPEQETRSIAVPGHEPPDGKKSFVLDSNIVGAGYFKTMGINVVRGREFDERDAGVEGRQPIVINETMARRFWPQGDAVGQIVGLGPQTEAEVVGVVSDIKYYSVGERPLPFFYLMFGRNYRPEVGAHLRTTAPPDALKTAVRKELEALDPDVAATNLTSFSELRQVALAPGRAMAVVSGAFGLLALVLAVVGIYGVMSYAVSQRTREIGIRMALGAQTRDVLRLIVGQGLALTLVGVAAGLAAALLLTRFLSSVLFGVSASDPVTFAGVALVLAAVALLACYVPARRATKVDPMVALRYE
ncbi:MAG TPA: ABC transporter permease [Pyrinomonadaceae bacterium]|nr:ABC transporter permease [Pyrinomonadaceae bacterium]